MAWDKEKDRKLAARARIGRYVYKAGKLPYRRPATVPKNIVPDVTPKPKTEG